MRHGDGRGLEGVMRHNRLDIINLAALLQPLRDAFHDPAAYGARIVPAKLHTAGEEGVYAELLNNQGILDSSECLELARLAKRKGAWCVAEAALCPLAARRDPAAMLQLAKLCEHQLGEIERALELTLCGCARPKTSISDWSGWNQSGRSSLRSEQKTRNHIETPRCLVLL